MTWKRRQSTETFYCPSRSRTVPRDTDRQNTNRNMHLLSKALVSDEYRDLLRKDLANARVCRFLVAYISESGIESIGRQLLIQALSDQRSFGTASISCSCGYEPMIDLQSGCSEPRLKYFMDPKVGESAEPDDLVLFHSKLVYILLEAESKAVAYIGSHNWSRRALGPGGPRNAEVSLRVELDFIRGDLEGAGTSLGSQINRHLLDAWNLPLCLPATEANRSAFEEWYAKGCRRVFSEPLQRTTILLAVRKGPETSPTPLRWLKLEGHGIYLQVLDENDGKSVWTCGDKLLVLVWDSSSALQSARQPIILQCRVTTYNACPGSSFVSTNQSESPVEGFEAVIFEEAKLAARLGAIQPSAGCTSIWSGRNVATYDFEFPTQRSSSSEVDQGVVPKYRFHLEVERVVFPSDGELPPSPRFVWERETFAVAESRKAARVHEKPGFRVEPQICEDMLNCLKTIFLASPTDAKVLPYCGPDNATLGKRVSNHPLHDTFIGQESRLRRSSFHSKAPLGLLVASVDGSDSLEQIQEDLFGSIEPTLPSVLKVFTMPFDDLFTLWSENAKNGLTGRNEERKP